MSQDETSVILKPKYVIWPIVVTIALYTAFSFWTSRSDLIQAATNYRYSTLAFIVIVPAVTVYIHYLKWLIFLTHSGCNIPKGKDRILIFLAGNALAVTPGKLGEVIKSYLLLQRFKTPLARSVPATLADRTTDMVTLYILATLGLYCLTQNRELLLAMITVPFFLLCLIYLNKTLIKKILAKLFRLPVVQNQSASLDELSTVFFKLLKERYIIVPLGLSFLAWTTEGVGLYYALQGAGVDISHLIAQGAYYASSLIGAVSLSPGGIGTTEGALAVALFNQSINESQIVISVLLIRLATLWIPVLIGIVALITTTKILKKSTAN